MIWVYAAWGLFGGLAVEALEFLRAIRRAAGMPWKNEDGTRNPAEPGPGALAISVVIRMGIGGGLAAAAGASGQVSGPLAAITIGVAAPLIIEQFGGQMPALDGAATKPAPVRPVQLSGQTHAIEAHGFRYPDPGVGLQQLDDELAGGQLSVDAYLRLRAAMFDGPPDRTKPTRRVRSWPPVAGKPPVQPPGAPGREEAGDARTVEPGDRLAAPVPTAWGSSEPVEEPGAGWLRQGPEMSEALPVHQRLGNLVTALTRHSPAFRK